LARFTFSFSGSFQAALDGQPVTSFESAKAHASLSQALTNLRSALGDRKAPQPILLTSRQTIQFDSDGDAFVDVKAFVGLASRRDRDPINLADLEEAASLYRGCFLQGFSLAGCTGFEEWLMLEQEQLRRVVARVLTRLSDAYEANGDIARALTFTWHLLELDPWRESAHRRAMRLLARSGRRGDAIVQYQTCCTKRAEPAVLTGCAARQTLYVGRRWRWPSGWARSGCRPKP
jgi:DNA-binding SARP family transcriptional activator